MRRKIALLMALALAVLAHAALTASAQAASFEIKPAGNITLISLGAIDFEESLTGIRVNCNMTLSGSLRSSTITKVAGTLVGDITAATCSSGTWTATGTPWHISYVAISGTLPRALTSISLLLSGVTLLLGTPTIFGNLKCRYEGDLEATLSVTGRNPFTTGLLRLNESTTLHLVDETLNSALRCFPTMIPHGIFELTPGQTLTRI